MMAKNRQQQVALITSTFIVYVLQSIKPVTHLQHPKPCTD